jgi:transcriptional regulator with XRE-family HTH domain
VTTETFPEALRRLRCVRGKSLRELGDLVGYSRKTIHNFEKGDRRPYPDVVEALDNALGAGGYLVHLAAVAAAANPVTAPPMPLADRVWRRGDAEALANSLITEDPTPENALTLAHEWLVTDPPQVYELGAGRRIGGDLVDQLEQRVHQIRLIDDHVGGRDTYAMATTELAVTAELLREASFTEEVGRRLLAVVSELCQIAGWITSDAGRHGEARRLYLAGARSAHAANDAPGVANNLSSLAYQIANADFRVLS